LLQRNPCGVVQNEVAETSSHLPTNCCYPHPYRERLW
jgi:hypothetical protein